MLPSENSDFATKDYWDNFFIVEQRKTHKSFEWYGEFEHDLLPLLHNHRKIFPSRALVLGCGNSTLSQELFDLNYASSVTSVDFSTQAIDMMKAHSQKRGYTNKQLEWVLGDMTNLPKEYSSRFEQVWDKGGIDALLGGEDVSLENGTLMIHEAHRCLAEKGVYFCTSLLQPHVLDLLLEQGSALFSSIDVSSFVPRKDTSSLCPFFLTMVKSDSTPSQCVWSVHAREVQSMQAVKDFVRNAQESFAIKREIRMHTKPATHRGEIVCFSPEMDVRFTMNVVDGNTSCTIPYAVLIVPKGREHEWGFSKLEGQLDLMRAQKIGRLLFVTLGRDQVFTDMASVQAELSPYCLEFKPRGASSKQIPFLGIAEELGSREVLETGPTDVNGEYSVEEVVVNRQRFRRLVFLENPLAIQSEIQVQTNSSVDVTALSFDIHRAMKVFLPKAAQHILVCGVGAGGLMMHVNSVFPNKVSGIEIDSAVLKCAEKWFGFTLTSKVHVGDALVVLKEDVSCHGVDVLLVDINAGGMGEDNGLVCPPKVFLAETFLCMVRDVVLLSTGGRFVLNFACRSKEQRSAYLLDLKRIFGHLLVLDMLAWNSEDLNLIVCASREEVVVSDLPKDELLEVLCSVNPDGSLALVSAPSPPAAGTTKKKKNKNKKKAG